MKKVFFVVVFVLLVMVGTVYGQAYMQIVRNGNGSYGCIYSRSISMVSFGDGIDAKNEYRQWIQSGNYNIVFLTPEEEAAVRYMYLSIPSRSCIIMITKWATFGTELIPLPGPTVLIDSNGGLYPLMHK